MNWKLAIVNGPNLNKLGKREAHHYGRQTWETVREGLEKWGFQNDIPLLFFQSNSEGALIDYLQNAEETVSGILFNPGAYAHTSIALADCVASLSIPVVEVHISKTGRREPFRAHSYIAEAAQACIVGFGVQGYRQGLELLKYLTHGGLEQR